MNRWLRPLVSQLLPAKPQIIVDCSIGCPTDATRLFAPTTEEEVVEEQEVNEVEEEVEEEEVENESIHDIRGGEDSSVLGQPLW